MVRYRRHHQRRHENGQRHENGHRRENGRRDNGHHENGHHENGHLENGHDSHVKQTATNENGQQPTFVDRVTSIPFVVDGMSTMQAYANKSSLGRLALSKANATLTSVSSCQPQYVQSYYETYLQPHIQRADSLGCRSLDLIETKFPVVSQSTATIVSAITAPPQKIIGHVRDKLDATLTIVVTPAQSVARQANERLASVVDGLESALYRYLPSDTPSETRATDSNPVLRAYHVLSVASLRLGKLLPCSRDAVVAMTNSIALKSITANLQFVNEAMQRSITAYSEAAKSHLPGSVTDHLHVLHGKITHQLNQVYLLVKSRTELPDWLQARVKAVVDTANAQYEVAKREYQRSDISSYAKAKRIAQGLQTQLLPVLEMAQSQLQQYTNSLRQRAQEDYKLPLTILGLNGAAKVH